MTRGQKGGSIYPVPPMYKIERWWSRDTLHTLARLKQALDELHTSSPSDDLLEISFCRVMMANSNAAFNHQSMSFKKAVANPPQAQLFEDGLLADEIPSAFSRETDEVLSSASVGLAGHATAMLGDARQMDSVAANSVDLLCTSPPYANRMSYIRELRPYMYWLGFLKDAKQAGELDWKAIGGTWGVATSRLASVGTYKPATLSAKTSPVRSRTFPEVDELMRILSRDTFTSTLWTCSIISGRPGVCSRRERQPRTSSETRCSMGYWSRQRLGMQNCCLPQALVRCVSRKSESETQRGNSSNIG